jgi:hypothetical protein
MAPPEGAPGKTRPRALIKLDRQRVFVALSLVRFLQRDSPTRDRHRMGRISTSVNPSFLDARQDCRNFMLSVVRL